MSKQREKQLVDGLTSELHGVRTSGWHEQPVYSPSFMVFLFFRMVLLTSISLMVLVYHFNSILQIASEAKKKHPALKQVRKRAVVCPSNATSFMKRWNHSSLLFFSSFFFLLSIGALCATAACPCHWNWWSAISLPLACIGWCSSCYWSQRTWRALPTPFLFIFSLDLVPTTFPVTSTTHSLFSSNVPSPEYNMIDFPPFLSLELPFVYGIPPCA